MRDQIGTEQVAFLGDSLGGSFHVNDVVRLDPDRTRHQRQNRLIRDGITIGDGAAIGLESVESADAQIGDRRAELVQRRHVGPPDADRVHLGCVGIAVGRRRGSEEGRTDEVGAVLLILKQRQSALLGIGHVLHRERSLDDELGLQVRHRSGDLLLDGRGLPERQVAAQGEVEHDGVQADQCDHGDEHEDENPQADGPATQHGYGPQGSRRPDSAGNVYPGSE